jgi:hypothetical protein
MRRSLLTLGALATAAFLTTQAHAAPIPAGSTLNIEGTATFNSTTVTSGTPAGMLGGNSGGFAALGTCLACVTVNQPSYTYSPVASTGLLFTVVNNGDTATITLGPGVTFQTPSTGILDIEDDNATLTMTGFDTTHGSFDWTINELAGGGSGSFSATAVAAAPEPTALALLGTGLIGLAGLTTLRRRRRR